MDAKSAPIWTEAADAEIAALVRRHREASGFLMRLANFVGSRAETAVTTVLGPAVADLIAEGTLAGLRQAYSAASFAGEYLPATGSWANRVGVVLSGAVGGFGGLATTVAEVPVATATMFGSIQRIAASHGFDPEDEDVKLHCLAVFASGGPSGEDDAVEIAYLGHRLTVNGVTVSVILNAVAPKLAALLTQKLAAQAVPVLGAVSGATVNYAFLDYFEEMAEVRFRLLKLGATYGEERVLEQFRLAASANRRTKLTRLT